MKKIAFIGTLLALPLAQAFAEPSLYGRADVSFEIVDEYGETGTELQNNASRLGIKGSETLNDRYEVVYQLEYGVNFDDGRTFSQRNIFLGVQSDWGRLIGGHFDTPFKRAQGKVDLFNDLRGDIKNTFTVNEVRSSNTVMYTTPDSFGPLAANVAYISSEDASVSDGISVSASYTMNNLYTALAADQDVAIDGADALRMVAVYHLSDLQLGAMVEMSDTDLSGTNEGLLMSAQYQIDAWALKAQVSHSDIVAKDTSAISLGADYKLSPVAKVYGFLSYAESDQPTWSGDPAIDGTYLGAGFQLKF